MLQRLELWCLGLLVVQIFSLLLNNLTSTRNEINQRYIRDVIHILDAYCCSIHILDALRFWVEMQCSGLLPIVALSCSPDFNKNPLFCPCPQFKASLYPSNNRTILIDIFHLSNLTALSLKLQCFFNDN